jgi:hypothetical protein
MKLDDDDERPKMNDEERTGRRRQVEGTAAGE